MRDQELDCQIKEAPRAAVAAVTLEERLTGQKQIKAIEAVRGKGRRAFFDAQDEIDRRREQLINEIERKLQQKVNLRAALRHSLEGRVGGSKAVRSADSSWFIIVLS